MGLNRRTGNMFKFCTHTWNPIRGRCEFVCRYCYVRAWYARFGRKLDWTVRLDEEELERTRLTDGRSKPPKRRTIFVGSAIDMWHPRIPADWIHRVLRKCRENPRNAYLFLTKNPVRYIEMRDDLVLRNQILGVTIETSGSTHRISNAPPPLERVKAFSAVRSDPVFAQVGVRTRFLVVIEPIMSFDLYDLLGMIKMCRPDAVAIGAYTGIVKNAVPEPSGEMVRELIHMLRVDGTTVLVKQNAKRLLKDAQEVA